MGVAKSCPRTQENSRTGRPLVIAKLWSPARNGDARTRPSHGPLPRSPVFTRVLRVPLPYLGVDGWQRVVPMDVRFAAEAAREAWPRERRRPLSP